MRRILYSTFNKTKRFRHVTFCLFVHFTYLIYAKTVFKCMTSFPQISSMTMTYEHVEFVINHHANTKLTVIF